MVVFTGAVVVVVLLLLLQPFYGSLDFVQDNPGEPVPLETFTHSHLSWSSIIHPLSASICYDHWHPPCSIYLLVRLFAQSLSKFSLAYLLAWNSLLHTLYISSRVATHSGLSGMSRICAMVSRVPARPARDAKCPGFLPSSLSPPAHTHSTHATQCCLGGRQLVLMPDVFTTRCTTVQSAVLLSLVVCPSVCDVGGS